MALRLITSKRQVILVEKLSGRIWRQSMWVRFKQLLRRLMRRLTSSTTWQERWIKSDRLSLRRSLRGRKCHNPGSKSMWSNHRRALSSWRLPYSWTRTWWMILIRTTLYIQQSNQFRLSKAKSSITMTPTLRPQVDLHQWMFCLLPSSSQDLGSQIANHSAPPRSKSSENSTSPSI